MPHPLALREEARRLWVEERCKLRVIGERLGVHPSTVGKWSATEGWREIRQPGYALDRERRRRVARLASGYKPKHSALMKRKARELFTTTTASQEEIAERCGISQFTLRNWIKSGDWKEDRVMVAHLAREALQRRGGERVATTCELDFFRWERISQLGDRKVTQLMSAEELAEMSAKEILNLAHAQTLGQQGRLLALGQPTKRSQVSARLQVMAGGRLGEHEDGLGARMRDAVEVEAEDVSATDAPPGGAHTA